MIQIPPRTTLADVGASVSASAGVDATKDGDAGAAAIDGAVRSASATPGEGDGEVAATHTATTARTARAPSIAMAKTFIEASFEHGWAGTTRVR